MKTAQFLSAVLLMALCSCSGSVGNITTPYPEYDSIYFWWSDSIKNVNQLWEITPRETSRILYEFTSLQSPEEALNRGLLTENDLKVLKQIPAIHDPNIQFNGQQIDISPGSLEISPDRHRLAWHEKILYYCVDSVTCIYGYIIRVFNIEDGKLASSISIPIEQEAITPIWSPDSKKLAFYTKQNDTDSPNNVVHVLDISTGTTTDIAGVDDNYPYSGRFKWMPDSNGIVLGNSNGLFLITLRDQAINHIFPVNNWWIFNLDVSPNGDFILFTGIKDVDDPTTPNDSRDNMSYPNQLIYLFDLNTYALRPVTNKNELGWIYSIYWLPDGQHFIYLHTLSSIETNLFIRNVSSNEIIMNETLPFQVDDYYSWEKSKLAKDGDKILFTSGSYNEATASSTVSLIIYNLNTKSWNKVPFPVELQEVMDKVPSSDFPNYHLSSPAW